MNKRIVYLGPNNNHVKEELKNLALEYLRDNKGDRFYYLLPNRELLGHYRNEFIDKLDGAFDLNFITFDDIVSKIVESKVIKLANDPIKRIIVRKVLNNLKDKSVLKHYNNFNEYNGFIESCIYIIGNIKRSLITPDEYLLKSGSSPYYRELGLIYKEYEKELKEEGYSDKESLYLKSIDLLKENKSFLEKLDFIVIDEFYDFRPIELEIIRLLRDLNINIYINIPYRTNKDNKRLNETLKDLKDLDFDFQEISKNKFSEFEKLANILFDNNDSKVNGNIELIKANSLYLEVKKIFKSIKNNYQYNSIDLDDNCICVFNNEYSNMIFKVAEEEKIPISMDNSTTLRNLPLSRELINLIELNLLQGDKDSFLNRIKSSYLQICDDESKDILEYILRRSKFEDLEDLHNKIRNEVSIDLPVKYREDIIDIINQLEREQLKFKEAHTLNEFNKILLNFLEDYQIEKNIMDRYKINEDFQLLQRDFSNLKYIRDVLSDMEVALFTEEMDLKDYFTILVDYFDQEEIIENHGNPNGVKIVTIDNARGMQYRNVFIPGLTQGIYPNIVSNNFFFSDDNYYILKKIGIDIKDYKNRLDNEILKFVSLISSCKEKLYLSCNLESNSDENPLYSMFLDEVLHKLKGDTEEEKVKITQVDLEFLYKNQIKDITSEREFTLKLFNDYYTENLDLTHLIFHNNLFKDKIEKINLQFESIINRASKEFNKYRGLLKDEFITEYIKREFKNRDFSVSFLESYSVCPYAFLLKNIFNIEGLEREVEDYDPMTNGTIYHEVLRVYYERYKDEFNKKDFNYENTLDFLNKTLLEQANKYYYSTDSNGDRLLIDNMYKKLNAYIKEDIKRLNKHKIKPWSFEEWFNTEFDINHKKIKIRGIIDRIDKIDDDKYIIIDYKTSSYGKKSIKDIENKISLQLPIYIISQEDKNVVGGFYGIINEADIYNCMGLIGETSLVSKRQGGAMDLEKWKETLSDTKITVGQLIEHMLEGNFSVNPKYCSPYCSYKDICRYDNVQEVE